jgi:hypothetical protein
MRLQNYMWGTKWTLFETEIKRTWHRSKNVHIVKHGSICLSNSEATIFHEARGGAVGEALRYKPEGRGIDSRCVIGIFHWHNPFGRTMALGSTQPLTEMNIRNISWGKGCRCVELTTLPPSCADCQKICLNLLKPSGSVKACNGISLPFTIFHYHYVYENLMNSYTNIICQLNLQNQYKPRPHVYRCVIWMAIET